MAFMALLILAYGPLDWSFPWWVWLLGLVASSKTVVQVKNTVVPVIRRDY